MSTNTVAAELDALRALAADAALHRFVLVALERAKRDLANKSLRAQPVDPRVFSLDLEGLLEHAEEGTLTTAIWGDAHRPAISEARR